MEEANRESERRRFWSELEEITAGSSIVIDRPLGSVHPKFDSIIYPVAYGYLDGTTGGDGEGIDIWCGTDTPEINGVFVTVDPYKRNCEVKIVFGCTEHELNLIREFYSSQPQAADFLAH